MRRVQQRAWLFLAAFALVLLGGLLEATLGQRFLFAGANGYRQGATWIMPLLTILVGWCIWRSDQRTDDLRRRFPTRFIRKWMVLPAFAAMGTGVVLIAPLGWLALIGWATGAPVHDRLGQVVDVGEVRNYGRSCRHEAQVVLAGQSAKICIHGMVSGVPMQAGPVRLAGRLSPLGLYIEQVERVSP